jgi:translocation and assembly module TamB
MARRALLIGLGALLALAALGLGAVAAALASAPGHAAVRRLALGMLEDAIDGTVRIGALSGPLWRAAELRDVELATSDGRPVMRAARVRVRYALADLARGRYVLSGAELVRPEVVLEKLPDGRWNYERLFRLGEGEPGPARRRPLVELSNVRIVEGSFAVRDDSASEPRRFEGIEAELGRVRASHPDSGALVAGVRRLAVRLSHPALDVTRLTGEFTVDGDSVRFDLDRAELAGTRASVNGVARWNSSLALEADARVRRLSFRDLASLHEAIPREGYGRAELRVRVLPNGGAEVDMRGANVVIGRSRARGSARLALGSRGGVRIATMDADLRPLDLGLFLPLVDTLPARGLVEGRLVAEGMLSDLFVALDVSFTDELARGRPTNRVAGFGRLALGGRDGLTFRRFMVSRADFDFETIRRFAPPVGLVGRLGIAGTLEGPWRDATLDGTVRHFLRGGPASNLRGRVRLSLGDTVAVEADVTADSLAFDLLSRSYPSMPLAGMASGPVRVSGPLSELRVDGSLAGPWGAVGAEGVVAVAEAGVRLRGEGTLRDVDLSAYRSKLPPTALTGEWSADVLVPTGSDSAPTTGAVRVALSRSRAAGIVLERAGVVLGLESERILVDTAYLVQEGGTLTALGALGRSGGPSGQLSFTFRADTLASFAPLLRWALRAAGDTASADVGLEGSGIARGRLVGTPDAWEVDGSVEMSRARYGEIRAAALRASGSIVRGAPGFAARGLVVTADSLTGAGPLVRHAVFTADGSPDSAALRLDVDLRRARARASARVFRSDSELHLRLDSLELALPTRTWRLGAPISVVRTGDSVAIDSLELRAGGSSPRILVHGSLPVAAVGELYVFADSVPLQDVAVLLDADTSRVAGAGELSLRIAGASASPTVEMRAGLWNARVGEFRIPLFEVLARYSDRQLALKGGLWRDTAQVVTVSGTLPIDLSLTRVEDRLPDGPLSIRARSDSVDLAALGTLTDLVRETSGRLTADFQLRGSFEAPRLTGSVEIADGSFSLPALGARYRGIDARLDFADDRVRVTRARLVAGGRLDVSGTVRLARLSRPELDLVLESRGFEAFDIRDFGAVTGSGSLTLRGPALGATLSGRLVVDAGFLAFADLVEKRIVNLDDPEFRAVVDSNLAVAAGLAPGAHVVFLDSLRIEGLTVVMGPDVWLRSTEANIQLAGEFQVDKAVENRAERYRLDGTLSATRGTYRLVLGPTSKEFRVTRGTVRFFGTPDLNPDLDIAAEHTVRTAQGGELVVRAIIGGTLLTPRLTLESDQRPPLSETEIVSYLLFGRPSFEVLAAAGPRGNEQTRILASAVASYAAGELEQTLVGDLGLPLDYLAIRPGETPVTGGSLGLFSGFQSTRVEAGTQIGARTFLTLNAGLCEVLRGATSQLLGASVQYRVGGGLSLEASVEPVVRECRLVAASTPQSSRYQIGFDLFWQSGGR